MTKLWSKGVCDFSVLALRLRAKICSKGLEYRQVLESKSGGPFDGLSYEADYEPEPQPAVQSDSTEVKTVRDLQAVYNKISLDIYTIIVGHLDTAPLEDLADVAFGDGRALWDQMYKIYGSKGQNDAYPAAKQLIEMTADAYPDIRTFTNKFKLRYRNLIRALKADTGETIKELPDCILRGLYQDKLGAEYKTLNTIIETSDNMKFDAVVDKVLLHASKFDQENSRRYSQSDGGGAALAAYQRNSENKRKCFNCNLEGHVEKQCRKPCKLCGQRGHTRYSCIRKKTRGTGAYAEKKTGALDEPANSPFGAVNLAKLQPGRDMDVASLTNQREYTPQPQPVQAGTAYYAIAKGRDNFRGIVGNWNECSGLTQGVSGAIFKKFHSYRDAEDFIYGTPLGNAFQASECKDTELIKNPKIDSGADATYWGLRYAKELHNIQPASGWVKVANGRYCRVVAMGDYKNILTGVRIVDEFDEKLVSVSRLATGQKSVVFTDNEVILAEGVQFDRGTKIGARCGNLYEMLPQKDGSASFSSSVPDNTADLWHARCGHIHLDAILSGIKMGHLCGIDAKKLTGDMKRSKLCHACGLGKACKLPRSAVSESPRSSRPGEKLYMDIQELQATTLGGNRYALYIVDDFSRFCWVLFLRTKREAKSRVLSFVRNLRVKLKSLGHHGDTALETLRSDQAGEFKCAEFNAALRREGLLFREYSIAGDSTGGNGTVERMIRTITEMARTQLLHSGAPASLMGESMNYSVYIRNRMPTKANIDSAPPLKVLAGLQRPISVKYFRTFYAPVYVVKLPNELPRRHKHAPRAYFGRFLGFLPGYKGYKVMRGGKIFNRRDVYFNETDFSDPVLPTYFSSGLAPSSLGNPALPDSPFRQTVPNSDNKRNESISLPEDIVEPCVVSQQRSSSRIRDPAYTIHVPHNVGGDQKTIEADMLSRLNANFAGHFLGTDGYPYNGLALSANTTGEQRYSATFTPSTHRQAMNCPDADKWAEAEQCEMEKMRKYDVFEVISPSSLPHPPNNVMSCRWVYKIKYRRDGSVERYKARLVGRGYTQKHGEDYFETYAPVMDAASLNLIFSIAAQRRLHMVEYDVEGAFLTANMVETVYVYPPPGVQAPPGTLYRLRKSLYGCKQSNRNFGGELSLHLQSIGFKQSETDRCVYILDNGTEYAICGIHVDDGILCTSSKALETKILDGIRRKYTLGCVREPHHFLGMAVDQAKDGSITVRADQYICDLAAKFGVTDANPVSTPDVVGQVIKPGPLIQDVPYRQLVGCLLYVANRVRPDILQATNTVARFMSSPTREAWNAAKRVLIYLNTTKSRSLVFRPQQPNPTLRVFTDSDFGGAYTVQGTRRSTTGALVFHGDNLIGWKCNTQRTPALSVCEAEIMAAVTGGKLAKFLLNLLTEIAPQTPNHFFLSTDNSGTQKICNNPGYRGRVKHMDLRWNWLRYLVTEGHATVSHVPGASNPADVLTKAIPQPQFTKLVRLFMTDKT